MNKKIMGNKQYKRENKVMHVAESFYTNLIVKYVLKPLGNTFVTPNMVTLSGSFLAILIFYLIFQKYYFAIAILIQVYLFIDILDGNLARYKDMKSKLGATLDTINDTMFYNLLFIFLGINVVPIYLILGVVLLLNLYGIIATYYIVPRLRKLKHVQRRGLKKIFMDKGYIIGMDLGTVCILTSIFLIIGCIKLLYIVLIIGYILDILLRIHELNYNIKLEKKAGV